MKVLISSAGFSDPIRNYHDGSLLHIVRVKRPEKIIVIHSAASQKRHEDLVYAIENISDDYRPNILQSDAIIEDVAYFDRVYQQMSEIVSEVTNEEDEFILNLSSGTPQMKSAFFAINQIYDYNFRAMQVMTPTGKSNTGIAHDDTEDIETLVETNLDNQQDYENRVVEDKASKFSQTLTVRNLITLVDHYDYMGALDLIENQKNFPNYEYLHNRLKNEIISDLQKNVLPKEIKDLKVEDLKKHNFKDEHLEGEALDEMKQNELENFKKTLYSFLIIQMKYKQGEIAEVLVRMQSLAEFLVAYYLSSQYPGIIQSQKRKNYLVARKYPDVENHLIELSEDLVKRKFVKVKFDSNKDSLGIFIYRDILKYLEPGNPIIKQLNHIDNVRFMRNSVAHHLEEIPSYDIENIERAYNSVLKMLKEVFSFDESLLNFYDEINEELKSYL